jgi:ComEC/Rec2-related protein
MPSGVIYETRPLFKCFLLYIIGIIASQIFQLSPPFLFITTLILGMVALFSLRKYSLISNISLTLGIVSTAGFFFRAQVVSNPFLPYLNKEIVVAGTIANFPERTSRGIKFILNCSEPTQGRILVLVKDTDSAEYLYWSFLKIKGKLFLPQRKRYFLSQRISALLRVYHSKQVINLGRNEGNLLGKWIFSVRQRLSQTIEQTLPSAEANLLKGILLGERGAISRKEKENFKKCALYHILAISGLHVTLFLFIFYSLLRFLRIGLKIKWSILILAALFYCFFTGARVPVIRATIIAVCFLCGKLLDREVDIYNILGLGGLLILVHTPGAVWGVDFQLSFGATLSIIYFMPRVENWLKNKPPILKYFLTIFLVSVFAQVGILPLVLYYFNYFNPGGIIINTLIIPLLTLGLFTGIIISPLGSLLPTEILKGISMITFLPLHLILKITSFLAQLGYFPNTLPSPPPLSIVCYYFGLLGFTLPKLSSRIRFLLGGICLFLAIVFYLGAF